MSFSDWDEIRTAYQVARMGTVSGAAEVLGVHHATVIRHIDALEGRLKGFVGHIGKRSARWTFVREGLYSLNRQQRF